MAEELEHRPGLSLFWRTFALLALLIFCSALAWLQLLRTQEYEPRMLRNAHQIASVVNLTRTALMHTDEIARVSLLKMLADEEDVSISTREPQDKFTPFGESTLEIQIGQELIKRLGKNTIIASAVNGNTGLWVGFQIEKDSYWLLMDPNRLNPVGASTWMVWLLTAIALSLVGAAVIALGAVLNQARTLVAHLWGNEGEAMTVTGQYLDSVNVPPPGWITVLWAPVGLRYHALHHLLPSVPYHALGKAHRRLTAELGQGSTYARSSYAGLFPLLARLVRSTMTARKGQRTSAT